MDLLGDQPFRMPDSWYDPPDEVEDQVDCPACDGQGTIPNPDPRLGDDDCVACGASGLIDRFEDEPDPDRAYEEMRDRRWEDES